jgi:hypothetical protein
MLCHQPDDWLRAYPPFPPRRFIIAAASPAACRWGR